MDGRGSRSRVEGLRARGGYGTRSGGTGFSRELGQTRTRPEIGGGVGDFRKLEVWRRAQHLAVLVYKATIQAPAIERFGLTAQMRRAAVSVSSDVAEGCGRRGDAELRRFLRISRGSLSELECQLLLARELAFLSEPDILTLLGEVYAVRGMLEQLHRSLRTP